MEMGRSFDFWWETADPWVKKGIAGGGSTGHAHGGLGPGPGQRRARAGIAHAECALWGKYRFVV